MDLAWNITDDDVAKLKAFVTEYADNSFVKHRITRNLTNRPTSIDRDHFWHCHIGCLLTTQQRSGPKSHVMRFIDSEPFPLSLTICRECSNVDELVLKTLTDYGGIRFPPKIAKQVAHNLKWLEDRRWSKVAA